MANVELVIRIPEEDYERCKKKYQMRIYVMGDTIANGTVLPKGHERLIAEPTEEDIAETIGGKNDFAECIREAVKTVFDNAKTIVEADKETEQ